MTEFPFSAQTDTLADAGPIDHVCRFWASLPRTGLAPDRMALDAQALAPALPHVFLAELVTPRVARLRLVGHAIEDLTGLDMRGMPLSALFTADARPILTQAFEQVSRGARVMLPLHAERGWGLPELKGQLALLPLCDGSGAVTRILGVLDHAGQAGGKPRRFDISSPVPTALVLPDAVPTPRRAPALRVIAGGKV
jgi:hypothetical protein